MTRLTLPPFPAISQPTTIAIDNAHAQSLRGLPQFQRASRSERAAWLAEPTLTLHSLKTHGAAHVSGALYLFNAAVAALRTSISKTDARKLRAWLVTTRIPIERALAEAEDDVAIMEAEAAHKDWISRMHVVA